MATLGIVWLLALGVLVDENFGLVGGGDGSAWRQRITLPSDWAREFVGESDNCQNGTRWAVLVAGSSGFGNYRHQADVCHAYQILKKGGLKDENIVVLMADDIAYNSANPRPGVIINHPQGEDVYAGVPKDYTGEHVTADNLYAVLLGDKKAVKGGTGKVVDSKPNDRIFVYYSDHGGPGVLGMPSGEYVYAKDFIETLKKKHASGTYKEMVIYLEACESGSILEGLLPDDLNIYATTASKADENSFGTYCPGMDPPPPPEFTTCLGDLYSVAWMEDSEIHNLKKESLNKQYKVVKSRTSNHNTYNYGSHVMEYGNKTIKVEQLYLYQGSDPANEDTLNSIQHQTHMDGIDQREADLQSLWYRYERSKNGAGNETELLKEIIQTVTHRAHVDNSITLIGQILLGPKKSSSILSAVRPSGQPLVDDWPCLKSMVRLFESECGTLTQYGMKHMRAFANFCNKGISESAMKAASEAVCDRNNQGIWSSTEANSA